MVTLTIILAFLLGVAIMVSALHYRNYKRACSRKAVLEREVKRLRLAHDYPEPVYQVQGVIDFRTEPVSGHSSVVRLSNIDGHIYETLIKTFNDDDVDFNHREAEELCDKLNEK